MGIGLLHVREVLMVFVTRNGSIFGVVETLPKVMSIVASCVRDHYLLKMGVDYGVLGCAIKCCKVTYSTPLLCTWLKPNKYFGCGFADMLFTQLLLGLFTEPSKDHFAKKHMHLKMYHLIIHSRMNTRMKNIFALFV